MRGTWQLCNLLVCLYIIIIVNLYVLNNYNILSSTAQDGTSPLFIASQNGHTQNVELLLKKVADPNLTDMVCGPWIIHTNVDWNRFRNLCVTEFQSLLSAYTEIVHVINHGGTRGKCRRFRSSF